MAKVLGSPGGYVSEQSVKKHQRFILWAFIGCSLISFLFGMFTLYDLIVRKQTLATGVLLPTVFLLVLVVIGRIVSSRMGRYEKERINFLKGATGEQAVAKRIDDFPDEFCVIHDLATPFGNLDHVVIGPTGVFVLETKNWKGIITADGRGGILLNGRRHLKDVVRPLIVRMMNVRTKINTLCDTNDELPYFRALMVFPSARVEAKWGQTGQARCISDEQLWDCIVETDPERRLNSGEIDRLAHGFNALASMDRKFLAGEHRQS